MNIIIKNSIDNITKCDIIFIEIKNVETKDGCHDTISYQNTEFIYSQTLVSQSVPADGSLFIDNR